MMGCPGPAGLFLQALAEGEILRANPHLRLRKLLAKRRRRRSVQSAYSAEQQRWQNHPGGPNECVEVG